MLYTWYFLMKFDYSIRMLTSWAHCKANVLAQVAISSCWAKFRFSLITVACDMIVLATRPVASVGVNKCFHVCMRDTMASRPTSVAQVTNHLTISLRLQFNEVSVILITYMCNNRINLSRLT